MEPGNSGIDSGPLTVSKEVASNFTPLVGVQGRLLSKNFDTSTPSNKIEIDLSKNHRDRYSYDQLHNISRNECASFWKNSSHKNLDQQNQISIWRTNMNEFIRTNKTIPEMDNLLRILGIENAEHIEAKYAKDGHLQIDAFVEDILTKVDDPQQSIKSIRNLATIFGQDVSAELVTQIITLENEIKSGKDQPEKIKQLSEKLSQKGNDLSTDEKILLKKAQNLLSGQNQQDESKADDSKSSESNNPSGNLSSISDIGTRSEQQDFTLTKENNLPGNIKSISIVADGHGSQGEQSSRSGAQFFVSNLYDTLRKNPSMPIENAIKQSIQYSDQQVSALYPDGGTTFIASIQVGDKIYIVNVGDSRAYHLSNKGELNQITTDHNWPGGGYKYDIAVSRALGDSSIKARSGGEFNSNPDIFNVNPNHGDYIILCSDGIHNVLSSDEIKNLTLNKTPQEATHAINAAAKTKSNLADNISINVLKIA